MRIVVAGGTGFIGRHVCRELHNLGHELFILSRRGSPGSVDGAALVQWDPAQGSQWAGAIGRADAVINLAGEPIADGRWNEARKQAILTSRVLATRAIVSGLGKFQNKPSVLINASAIGYYGLHEDEDLDEQSPNGSDFLAEVCRNWEKECVDAEKLGVRTVRLRFGIVLGLGGGAMAKMLLPFKLGVGGPLGSGRQWMSWVHIQDVTGLVLFILDKVHAVGAINVTSPNPVTNAEFSKTLGAVLHRPAFLPAPAFALRLALGEMAHYLLTGQKVFPKKAQTLGYSFRYPHLEQALQNCL